MLPCCRIVLGLLTLRLPLGLALAWAGMALSPLLILPMSVGWLVAQVEYPPAARSHLTCARRRAIVVLSAGEGTMRSEFGSGTVNRLALGACAVPPRSRARPACRCW